MAYSRCDALWRARGLNALTKKGSKEFYENWSFVPFNTGYDTMCFWKHMIPFTLKNHLQDVK